MSVTGSRSLPARIYSLRRAGSQDPPGAGNGALDGSMVGYPSGTGSNNRIPARSDKCHFLTHRYAERNKLLFGGAGFPSGGF